jgi:DNA-binding protein HU-beta
VRKKKTSEKIKRFTGCFVGCFLDFFVKFNEKYDKYLQSVYYYDKIKSQIGYKIIKYEGRIFTMNKTELIAAVAEKTGLTKKDAERVINATVETIETSLVKGEKVQISGFGIFEVKAREARVGRNPRTKETIQIPATRLPVFKASKALKDVVAK